jgi:FkbM family methyltransferase
VALIAANEFARALERFGATGVFKLMVSRRRLRALLPAWTTVLDIRGYAHPLHFRHATTDKYVIAEVLLKDQYQPLSGRANVRTIIDAGANIGTASVYLLNHYPKARLIALEPDPGNFAILQRNLAPYGTRAVALQQALWHRVERLSLDRGTFRDGGEWSVRVKAGGSSDVQATTFDQLFQTCQLTHVDILKIDIEGAERHVFGADASSAWLERVEEIAIELHDPACRAAFMQTIAGQPGEISQQGEVTFWRRTR